MALSLKQPSPAQGSSLSLGARLHSNEAIATAQALSLLPLSPSPFLPLPLSAHRSARQMSTMSRDIIAIRATRDRKKSA